jgi:hypothetical protein
VLRAECNNRFWRKAEIWARLGRDKRALIVTNEEDVLAALDKPRAVYALQQLLDPSSKSTEALQDLLMRMRSAGKVKFDIKSGKWSKA